MVNTQKKTKKKAKKAYRPPDHPTIESIQEEVVRNTLGRLRDRHWGFRTQGEAPTYDQIVGQIGRVVRKFPYRIPVHAASDEMQADVFYQALRDTCQRVRAQEPALFDFTTLDSPGPNG